MQFTPAIFLILLFLPVALGAQEGAGQRWTLELSAQANLIVQGNADFQSPYSGGNSIPGTHDVGSTRVVTFSSLLTMPGNLDIEADVESATGRVIGDGLGLAAYPNMDIPRDPSLGATPYLSRLVLHRGFGRETASKLGRLDVYVGQFNAADWFDGNAVGSNSHTQFMNWAVDNNAAYDYPALTRGVVVQWSLGRWEIRAGELMLPAEANGLRLSWSKQTHSENVEVQRSTSLLGRPGTVRALAFVNHANMGSYRQAIDEAAPREAPDINCHRRRSAMKYGFGTSLEQEITHTVRGFLRLGWNEGRNESLAFTEANNTVAVGMDVRYARSWKTGLAFVSNGLSADHRQYLARGGSGFLLGDGRLNYGREIAVESYTTVALGKGFSFAIDLQYIANPGYNRDRGPVWVPGLRLHWESRTWRKNLKNL